MIKISLSYQSLNSVMTLACLLLCIDRGGKMKKKRLLIWALLLVVLASEGCATVRGMGEDIQSIGRAVKRAVSE
jgi:predicted small secreted protein